MDCGRSHFPMTKVDRFIFICLKNIRPVVFHVNEFVINLSTKIIKDYVSYFVSYLDAFLSSFSTSRRCSRNRSPCRLPVSTKTHLNWSLDT